MGGRAIPSGLITGVRRQEHGDDGQSRVVTPTKEV